MKDLGRPAPGVFFVLGVHLRSRQVAKQGGGVHAGSNKQKMAKGFS